MEMIDARGRAVLDRLEARDARERDSGVARGQRLRQVTPDVGIFLHTLILAARPPTIVEIGTSGGYSTIWLASAARQAGATVTTLEIDPVKVETARESLSDAGLAEVATVVEGDAFVWLRERAETVDFAFLDAEKEDYLAFLGLVVPLISAGGLLVADNLTSHAEDLEAFRQAALSDPRLSGLVVPIGRGELVAVRLA